MFQHKIAVNEKNVPENKASETLLNETPIKRASGALPTPNDILSANTTPGKDLSSLPKNSSSASVFEKPGKKRVAPMRLIIPTKSSSSSVSESPGKKRVAPTKLILPKTYPPASVSENERIELIKCFTFKPLTKTRNRSLNSEEATDSANKKPKLTSTLVFF